jgi:hypothetical protein
MKNRLATGSTSFTIDFSKRWVWVLSNLWLEK